jgi:hypothetical protein
MDRRGRLALHELIVLRFVALRIRSSLPFSQMLARRSRARSAYNQKQRGKVKMNASRKMSRVESGMMGCLSPLLVVVLLALLGTAVAASWHLAKNANGAGRGGVDMQSPS